MDYNNILEALRLYGTSKEDIIKRRGFENILENVVIAPWWEHSLFANYSNKIEQVSEKVFNVYGEGFAFSFIEIKNIGASALIEEVLPLGLTKCKRVIFIGSAGALNKDINIGDLAVPVYSYNGVGATRYLNEGLKDDFENRCYPSKELSNKMIEVIKNMGLEVHNVSNYSVDTIIAQFPHLNHIIDLKCNTLEMETSSLFKCADIIGVEASALFVISDNTIKNKSLYGGRKEGDKLKKKKARDEYVPKVVMELFRNDSL